MRLLLFVICSIFFISSISNVIAQDSSHVFFILIQIIQRDDDGTLITYIETNDVSEVNDSLLNFLLDELIEDENIKTYNIQGREIEVITQVTPLTTDSSGLLATVQFQMIDAYGDIHDIPTSSGEYKEVISEATREIIKPSLRSALEFSKKTGLSYMHEFYLTQPSIKLLFCK